MRVYLETALTKKAKLIRNGSAYYELSSDDEVVDGPFCTKCFDIDHVNFRTFKST